MDCCVKFDRVCRRGRTLLGADDAVDLSLVAPSAREDFGVVGIGVRSGAHELPGAVVGRRADGVVGFLAAAQVGDQAAFKPAAVEPLEHDLAEL